MWALIRFGSNFESLGEAAKAAVARAQRAALSRSFFIELSG